ncbi:dTDP-glucose 4,6-dehydratase [Nocardia sp. NPDC057663]|uniref:dTDP-glucose 4,6-dehydratase n=1 Tax=Nocardia sp. NPDC057663 TaxID=3346201 RepID=UPI00366D3B47
MTHILVTGAAGFIGSNFVDLVLAERPDVTAVTGVDKLGYAGDRRNVDAALRDDRFRFVEGDISNEELAMKLTAEADEVAHFAAESMVDRSVLNPRAFLESNVLGTGALLQGSRMNGIKRFLQISTPEVYGERMGAPAAEREALFPRNIYAGSKAAAEMLCSAYLQSFKVPIVFTRGSVAIGPRQHPEKVTPRWITAALQDSPLPVYGDGSAVRDFIHVDDLNRANSLVLQMGVVGTAYNVISRNESSLKDLAHRILDHLEKPRSLAEFTVDRVAHDYNYKMDDSGIRALGWKPTRTHDEAVADTIDWYRSNASWWQPKVASQEFNEYLAASSAARSEFAARNAG